MRHPLILSFVALSLAACATAPPAQVPVQVDPAPVVCPAAATAPLEAAPVAPAVTDTEDDRFIAAVVGVLGVDRGLAMIEWMQATFPAYARRQAARVEDVQRWCAAPRPGG